MKEELKVKIKDEKSEWTENWTRKHPDMNPYNEAMLTLNSFNASRNSSESERVLISVEIINVIDPDECKICNGSKKDYTTHCNHCGLCYEDRDVDSGLIEICDGCGNCEECCDC